MWHSLPAAFIAALFVFLVSASENIHPRLFKTLAVFVGFMSHILLDELWSVEFRRGKYVFKHSFGTALKFLGESRLANIATYVLLISLSVVAYHDESIMEHFGYNHQHDLPHTAVDWLKTIQEQSEYWIR
jgi:membrane-bound metal-dependent hydrolase YbcI (DUF457 family)